MIIDKIKNLFKSKEKEKALAGIYYPIYIIEPIDPKYLFDFVDDKENPRNFIPVGSTRVGENGNLYYMCPPFTTKEVTLISDFKIGVIPPKKLFEVRIKINDPNQLNQLLIRNDGKLNIYMHYQVDQYWFLNITKEQIHEITEGEWKGYWRLDVPWENACIRKINLIF